MGMVRLPWNVQRVQELRMMLSQAPGFGESGPDRELHAFMNTGEDRLQTGSSDERQQMPSGKEQLPPPTQSEVHRVERREDLRGGL